MLSGGFAMKQQCPKCGNWVEGYETNEPYVSEDGRSALQVAGKIAVSLGQSEALDIIPGGRLAGLAASALTKGAINLFVDNAKKTSNKYVCACGYEWKSPIGTGFDDGTIQEIAIFQDAWKSFLNCPEDKYNTAYTKDFISKWESQARIMKQALPKSEMYFMLACASYCQIDDDRSFIGQSKSYINEAMCLLYDAEYQLFSVLVDQKEGRKSIESIVSEAVVLLDEIQEENMLLNKEYYINELNKSINQIANKYKEEVISKKRSSFLIKSLFCVPILLYIIYKCAIYETTHFWLFSWYPIYWLVIIMLGSAYVLEIMIYWKIIARSDDEWRELALSQYTSFKWHDLFK